ncbi:LOW QUALITY PROTEIN: hypothetical protein HID58_017375 [Brassica napus]|uniref:Uncharacterized protein n=1 Tax=Brassica napus TaxID=3708 RepID=A0ABQ8D6X5_BRANA|nr:LOW QUALITY PROTEIN: hypothetical protein HID58_017375 [Brassica napus]
MTFIQNSKTLARRACAIVKKLSFLTVWKKSLLFNCDGFTVYNSMENLVDNYMNCPKDNIVLMDAFRSTPPLHPPQGYSSFLYLFGFIYIYLRSKVLNQIEVEPWRLLDGIRWRNTKRSNIYGKEKRKYNDKQEELGLEEDSTIRDRRIIQPKKLQNIGREERNKKKTAEIKKKKKEAMVGGVAFGKDVFKLIVEPEMEPRVAMALTIILDQILDIDFYIFMLCTCILVLFLSCNLCVFCYWWRQTGYLNF